MIADLDEDLVTVPLVVKLAPAVLALSIVPDADTVELTVPRETVAVVVCPGGLLALPRVTMYAPTPMATRTATSAKLITLCWIRVRSCLDVGETGCEGP